MAVKKNIYISAELDWAEEKLSEWKQYIDDNPLPSLTDRMDYKETKNGGMVRTVVANIESQIKSLRDTMKEYLALLKEVDTMREREEAKQKEVRGGGDVPFRMRKT